MTTLKSREGESAGDVFIVDDNPTNLNLLAGILRKAGYAVRMANSGRRALAAIEKARPELILLDVNMPDMSGYEVCKRLAEAGTARGVPVIFLSALNELEDKMRAFEAGGVDYVTKPFYPEEVLARVASQIKLARLRAALEERNRELAQRNDELAQAHRREDRMFSAFAEVLPGTVLDEKYRLGERIGVGGFAAVYRATDVIHGRAVAVKVLRPHEGDRSARLKERLELEGISTARLAHPSAVTILDAGSTPQGIAYLVMELLEGPSLATELEAHGPLPLERALAIMIPICEVLLEAHAQGILHRDVKPANIVLHETRVKLVDFGLAKLKDARKETATTVGRLLGTPVYMAPERLLGEPHDTGADVYAVGITLFEILTGRVPFAAGEGGICALVVACVNEPVPLLRTLRPDVPAELEEIVARAVRKTPLERPTLEALLFVLREAAGLGGRPERTTRDAPI